jgi:hypothetical protein
MLMKETMKEIVTKKKKNRNNAANLTHEIHCNWFVIVHATPLLHGHPGAVPKELERMSEKR